MFNWLKKLFHREQTSKEEKMISAIIIFGYAFLIGLEGYITSWSPVFERVEKPAAFPPEWLFFILWTIPFVVLGIAGYFAWNYYKTDLRRKLFAALYLVNGLLVCGWTQLFFARADFGKALFVIIAVIIAAELMMITAFGTNRRSAYYLLPYLAWVLFVTYLNAAMLSI